MIIKIMIIISCLWLCCARSTLLHVSVSKSLEINKINFFRKHSESFWRRGEGGEVVHESIFSEIVRNLLKWQPFEKENIIFPDFFSLTSTCVKKYCYYHYHFNHEWFSGSTTQIIFNLQKTKKKVDQLILLYTALHGVRENVFSRKNEFQILLKKKSIKIFS